MKVVALIITSTLIMTGCASSGIVPTDKDTYTISKMSAAGMFGTPEGVKNDIYVEANEFCAKQNKAVETVNLQMNHAIPAVRQGSANLTFRCAKIGPKESDQCFKNLAGDPELVGLKDKVALGSANDQTFTMLADNSKPTAKEKELLKIWGSKRDTCIRLDREEMQEARAPLPLSNLKNSYLAAGQLLVADLMNGNLTYSGYAVKRQELATFNNDTASKIQAELRKETQDSRYKAEQLSIEAQRNDIMRQKIYSDSVDTQKVIQSNERINQQKNMIRPTTTTDCVTNGPGIRCTTH
jgi:hypothetical protein